MSQSRDVLVKVIDIDGTTVPEAGLTADFCGNMYEWSTDGNGIFRCKMKDGSTCTKARIVVKNAFYMPADTTADFSKDSIACVTLHPLALANVKVTGYRKIAKGNAEKEIFTVNTEGLLESTKVNVALKRIPKITYNNGSYCILGNNRGAKLLVDGIEVSEDELSKIDASEMEKVELRRIGLNDDGYSGEINILLKKNRQNRFKGEVGLGTNLLKPGVHISPSFDYRSSKVGLISWFTYVNDRQEGKNDIERDGAEVFKSKNNIRLKQYNASIQ